MEIQIAALKQIPAFKDLVIYRPGYAIEYDYFDPTQLKHTLESKIIKNLFFAGQVNGTTGYEEAGGQGLIAGINAHINCHGGEAFTLARDEAYIGVLIDDNRLFSVHHRSEQYSDLFDGSKKYKPDTPTHTLPVNTDLLH